VDVDIEGYLGRLGMAGPLRPDIETLRALHAAHAERVSYETVDIHLGRPVPSIEPGASVDRVLRHRGGYCYQLNGAFSQLLLGLGYDVVWHPGVVQGAIDAPPRDATWANHLPLTVHGLPTGDNPGGDWLVDVGLGDAMHQPLPLVAGLYDQPPFRLRLRPSEIEPGGWRLDHDLAGSFVGMDFAPRRATVDDFAARHRYLWSSPESGFTKVLSVQRREADAVDILRGCVLLRITPEGATDWLVDTRELWFSALADVFDLPLVDLTADDRSWLWSRVHAAHEAWSAGT
jgi:arylamine N-acetyltransferase